MWTLAVVPIKNFSLAKQRLVEALADGARASLVQAMFSDVLSALRRSTLVDAIAVVTTHVEADSIARSDGAVVLPDEGVAGQSAATQIGIEWAEQEGFERVLLVPGDTPLLDPGEVDALLERTERDEIEVAIVPDRHGSGTNALVIAPPSVFEPSFGPASYARHVEAAKAGRLAYRTLEVRSLAHDVDTPEDLAALWPAVDAQRSVAQRTRGALRQLERSGALSRPSPTDLAAPGVTG